MDGSDDWSEEDRLDRRELARDDVRAPFCRNLARTTLKRNRVAGPPVPVEDLARKQGLSIAVVRLPPGVDARLRRTGDRGTIELAQGQSLPRQRFSLAHELGHHVLRHRHG